MSDCREMVCVLMTVVLFAGIACSGGGSEMTRGEGESDQVEVKKGAPPACGDQSLVEATRYMLRTVAETGDGRQRLRQRCSADGDWPLRLKGCSCEALREYLIGSEEVFAWRAQCCADSAQCSRRERCTAAEVAPDRWVEQLKEATAVSIDSMEDRLGCVEAGCRATASDCQSSDACRRRGRCGVDEEGNCAPMVENHCVQSEDCREDQQCALTEPGGRCVCDLGDDACNCAQQCAEDGRCVFNEHANWCEPATDEHCRESRACGEQRRCYLGEQIWPTSGEPYPVCYSKVARAVGEAKGRTLKGRDVASGVLLRQVLEVGGEEATVEVGIDRIVDASFESVQRSRAHVTVELAGGDEPVVTTVDCEAYFEVMREVRGVRAFRQGEYRLYFEEGRVRSDDAVLYDHKRSACRSFNDTSRGALSWVGPVWSVEYSNYWTNLMGRGHGSLRRESFDLRTGEAAALDLLVDPDSVVEAIRQDPWVIDRLEGFRKTRIEAQGIDEEERREVMEQLAAFNEAETLDEVEIALAELLLNSREGHIWNAFWRRDGLFGGYAFFDYDASRDRVAMRLEIADRSRQPPEQPVTLGLWVTPRQGKGHYFERAASDGWLMNQLEGGGFSVDWAQRSRVWY